MLSKLVIKSFPFIIAQHKSFPWTPNNSSDVLNLCLWQTSILCKQALCTTKYNFNGWFHPISLHHSLEIKKKKKICSCYVFYSYYMVTSKCQDEKHTYVSISACLQPVDKPSFRTLRSATTPRLTLNTRGSYIAALLIKTWLGDQTCFWLKYYFPNSSHDQMIMISITSFFISFPRTGMTNSGWHTK